MSLRAFQAVLHARPSDAKAGDPLLHGGDEIETLAISPVDAAGGFPASFEDVYAALELLPRMFIEPDGAWVWSGEGWQLDGVLYDAAGCVQHVELKGTCPAAQFDRLLNALSWPSCPVMFQLARQGVFVDETTFRRLFLVA